MTGTDLPCACVASDRIASSARLDLGWVTAIPATLVDARRRPELQVRPHRPSRAAREVRLQRWEPWRDWLLIALITHATLLAICLLPFQSPFLLIILNILGVSFLRAWS